jgi:hypothetical protein
MSPLEEWRLVFSIKPKKRFCVLNKLLFIASVVFSPVFGRQKPKAGRLFAYLAGKRSVKVVEIAVAPT